MSLLLVDFLGKFVRLLICLLVFIIHFASTITLRFDKFNLDTTFSISSVFSDKFHFFYSVAASSRFHLLILTLLKIFVFVWGYYWLLIFSSKLSFFKMLAGFHRNRRLLTFRWWVTEDFKDSLLLLWLEYMLKWFRCKWLGRFLHSRKPSISHISFFILNFDILW